MSLQIQITVPVEASAIAGVIGKLGVIAAALESPAGASPAPADAIPPQGQQVSGGAPGAGEAAAPAKRGRGRPAAAAAPAAPAAPAPAALQVAASPVPAADPLAASMGLIPQFPPVAPAAAPAPVAAPVVQQFTAPNFFATAAEPAPITRPPLVMADVIAICNATTALGPQGVESVHQALKDAGTDSFMKLSPEKLSEVGYKLKDALPAGALP